MAGLQTWLPGSRRFQAIEPLRRLPVADVEHLRQSTGDLRPPEPPAALVDWDDDTELPDEDGRAWGGPHYAELDEHLAGFAGSSQDAADPVDLAAAFGAAPDALRRPVDLLGLLELAHARGMTETDRLAFVDAVRPDGTHRRLAFGATTTRPRTRTTKDDDA